MISVSNWLDWTYGEPPMGMHETGGKGAGDVHGTLREYAVLVSHAHVDTYTHSPHSLPGFEDGSNELESSPNRTSYAPRNTSPSKN